MPTAPNFNSFVRVAASNIHGHGVFAARLFAPLDVVLEIDDARLDAPTRDGSPQWDEAPERRINHSCEPNAFIKAIDGVHYVFALREIVPGEEIAIDYAINRCSSDHVVMPCQCGSDYCRGDVQLGFFDLPLALQIAYLPLLEEWFINRNSERISELCRLDMSA